MKPIFSTNSRFSILSENINNSCEKDYKRKNNFNRKIENFSQFNIKDLKEEREKKIIKDLSIENFPQLPVKSIVKNENNLNYLKIIKSDSICENLNSHLDICFERNSENENYEDNLKNIEERKLCNDIINSLVLLHEKRTNEYIELWGYDEWEKNFRFPNYDYEYFNKLDELYEEELEMENEFDYEEEEY